MNQQELKIQIASAEVLGTRAFKDGKKRIPAYDDELCKILDVSYESTERQSITMAWLRAWDMANINSDKIS